MYKISYDVCKINEELSVELTMFLQNDPRYESSYNVKFPKSKTITKFNISGNTYIKILPSVYLDLVISGQKGIYDKYNQIRCNKYDIFKLIVYLDKLTRLFKSTQDLYYYNENRKLILNDNRKNELSVIIPLRDRQLKIEPTVVYDEVSNSYNEGIIIYVNTESRYCVLKYIELEFLLYILKNTDIDSIANSLCIMDYLNIFKNTEDPKDNPTLEINTDYSGNDNTTTYATPKNGDTIPNI